MKHRFYRKSKKEQQRIQLRIGLWAFLINALVLVLSLMSGAYLLIFLSIAVSLSVIAPFFDTPSLKESGKLTYYSPLFLAEEEKRGSIQIHGGSLFDYCYCIDFRLSGKQRTASVLQAYLEGMLALIRQYEGQKREDLKIRGTSYIINEKTAQKLGFEVLQPEAVQMLILVYNYVPLTVSVSIAKARLRFPNLGNIKTYEADLGSLMARKAYMEELNEKLKKRTTRKQDPGL